MNTEITVDIVNDLWPLCRSGEASTDSRALVDRFLAENPDLAARLAKSAALSGAVPSLRLSPDAERRLLDEARRRARFKLLLIGGGITLVGFILLAALAGVMLLTFSPG
jgi:hypothetical protein